MSKLPVTLASLLLAAFCLARPLAADEITVFAAASLKGALDKAAAGFEAATGNHATLAFAGSSALARQIEQGAPANIFISANPGWMDRLEEGGLIATGSRTDLLGNRLVLIAPQGEQTPVAESIPAFLGQGDGRIAMALVDAVPAGIYGKAALESLGLWQSVSPRVVQADNVRAALALVALGEAPLGIVYATDAAAEPRVAALATFPEDSHPPIRYPAAAIAGRESPAAAEFLTYLRSEAAGTIFIAAGFTVLGQ